MSKLNRIDCYQPENTLYGYEFKCPGCGHKHIVPVGPGNGEQYARWSFNGNVDAPTFSPSILASGMDIVLDDEGEWTGEWKKDAAGNPVPFVCHSFVTDGRIQFLSDCTHTLAGQTVELLEAKP